MKTSPNPITFLSDYINDSDTNFYAISRDVHSQFSYDLQKSIISIINKNDSESSKFLRVYMYEFLRESLVIFQWSYYIKGIKDQGLTPSFDTNFDIAEALYNNRDLNHENILLKKLRRGLRSPKKSLLLLRAIYDIFDFSSIPRRRLKHINISNSIVTFTSDSFVNTLAKANSHLQVYRCSPWEWFNNSPTIDMLNQANEDKEISEEVLNTLRVLFSKNDLDFSSNIKTYFLKLLNQALPLVRYYYNNARNELPTPKIFWFGSTNNIYTRIIRQAVEDSGGKNVGFDHGRGMGLQMNNNEMGIVFDLCNEYYSYSETLTNALKNNISAIKDILPNKDQSLTLAFKKEVFLPKPNFVDKDVKFTDKIMYVSGLFKGQGVSGANCLVQDHVLIDWQIRLIQKLQYFEYKVSYKSHPESIIKTESHLHEKLNVELISGTIEETWDKSEAYIFDFLSSSFKTLSYTNRPIIFIDFGLGQITKEVRELLKKRCVIIKGWYDEQNRAQLDWEKLPDYLEQAKSKKVDLTVLDEFYGSK
ncbi:MAG: hypothetical protein GY909_14825 [Oligoflexia bacterium]|nr:hypothetical protein [Oligoflexia bacterium]